MKVLKKKESAARETDPWRNVCLASLRTWAFSLEPVSGAGYQTLVIPAEIIVISLGLASHSATLLVSPRLVRNPFSQPFFKVDSA